MVMKYLYLLALVVLFGCKEYTPAPPPALKIQWELLGNRHGGQDRWLSRVALINPADRPLTDSWELFFDFPSGRVIDTAALKKEGFNTRHWTGGHYSIWPESTSGQILPGDTLAIDIQASGSVIKNSDAPGGFYLVFDGNDEEVYLPEVELKPISETVSLYKGEVLVNRPDMRVLYDRYNELPPVEKEVLSPITPEPEGWALREGDFVLNEEVFIAFGESLRHEGEVLKEWLKADAGVSVSVGAGTRKGAPVIGLRLHPELSPEAYELEVTPGGVRLAGGSARGVFYGIQSMKALLVNNGGQKVLKGIEVKDAPAMDYRGMHLDVARNFSDKTEVLKLLDLMSLYKLNTFHFHLTDDEGWRIEIPGLPELTQIGGKRVHTRDEYNGLFHQYGSATTKSGSGYYTREQYIEILKYAAERHIEVIPEVDLPGHARAAVVAMKARERRLLQAGDSLGASVYLLHDDKDRSRYFSVQNYADNVINVCMPSAYTFIDKVVGEIQAMHKDAGSPLNTLHIGGDEVPMGVWEQSGVCMQKFPDSEHLAVRAKQYFVEQVKAILDKRGLQMAGWEEIGLVHNEGEKVVNAVLAGQDHPPLLYHWNNSSANGERLGQELAGAGYPVVLSPVTNLYFDMAYSSSPDEPGFYWGGFVDTRKVFSFAYPEALTKIRGIQGQLWSEVVTTPDRLEYMIFPKMLALAERAWKGNISGDAEGSWSNFAHRLGYFELPRLDAYGTGINYRLPPPSGFIKNDTLYLNAALPGLELRYSTSGNLNSNSKRYTGPIRVEGEVKAAAFRPSGVKSRPVVISMMSSR